MKILFSLLFFSFLLSVPQKEKKYWDNSNKLKAFDYKWVYKRPRLDVRAATVLGIENNFSFSNDSSEINFIVRSYALLSDSTWIWMVSSTDTLNTIIHEQVHFNIEEISARRYRGELCQIKCLKKDNFEMTADYLYKKQLLNRNLLHNEFDSLYSNSNNKKMLNILWLDSTRCTLKDLELYRNIKVEVAICR